MEGCIDPRSLVIAFFETRADADDAARSVAETPGIVATGAAVGRLALAERGDPEVVWFGPCGDRSMPVLQVLSSALAGGVLPRRRHLLDADTDLMTDDVARLGAELDAGHAVVAAVGSPADAENVLVLLTRLGGRVEIHRVSEEGLRRATSTTGSDPAR